MSFYEYWVESSSGRPGPIGTVKFGEQHELCRCKPLVIARFLFTVVALPLLWYVIIPLVPLPVWQAAAAVIGGTLIYVAVAYLVSPEPDMDNLGVAGGLIDNPFRYSDDVNRSLAGVAMLLGPGRFVAESVMDLGVLFEQPADDEAFGFPTDPPGDADEQLPPDLGASRGAERPSPPTQAEDLAVSGLSTARFMQSGGDQQEETGWSGFGR